MCPQWNRNCLPFQSTWVHLRFLVGFVLLDLWFCVCVLWIVVCPFVLFLLAIVLSVLLSFGHCVVCSSVFWPLCCLFFFDIRILITPFGIFKLFLYIIVTTLNIWFSKINITELHLINYSFKREAISIVKMIKYNQEIIGLLTARCRRFALLNLMGKRWINIELNNL